MHIKDLKKLRRIRFKLLNELGVWKIMEVCTFGTQKYTIKNRFGEIKTVRPSKLIRLA